MLKKLIFILPAALILAACTQETPVEEPEYPAPEAVTINDAACTANSIVVLFNGSKAIKAGAESFSAVLTPEGGVPIVSKTAASSQDACRHVFSDLSKGKYTVYAIATYAGDKESEKAYAMNSEGKTSTIVIEGGSLAVKLAYATSSTLAFEWSVSNYTDITKDVAVPYRFALYKDADCKDLVVAWKTDANASIWDADLAEGCPQFEFSGLSANTSYWFTVTDLEKNYTCYPLEGKTLGFTIVEPSKTGKIEEGGIALAEDFSELVWGGNYLRGSAAYSADDRNLATAFDRAEGENPINGGPWKWYLVPAGTEIGLYNTMRKAVASSRLQYWGPVNETVNGKPSSAICGRSGCLKLGASSYTALIATPVLENLKGIATVEVSFDQGRYDSDPTTAAVYVINNSSQASMDGGYEITPAIASLSPAAEFEIKAGRDFTTEKITLNNVSPTSRIAIGPTRKDGSTPGSSQHRMYIDNVIVKVVKYGATAVKLYKPVITSVEATHAVATVRWNKVDKADSYVLEYKKASDADYTRVELGDVTSSTLESLRQNTAYQVRLMATESVSGSASEYSDVYSFTTLAQTSFPMEAGTAEDFLDILSMGEGLLTAGPTDEIIIKADLDFAGKTLPAGAKFTGTINGQGHTLKNIRSDHPLFESICSAKDLTLDSSCSFTTTAGGNFAALAATADGGVLSHVISKATVSMTLSATPETASAVAGLVAVCGSSIDNCSNQGPVSVISTAGVTSTLVAGLAAFCSKPITSSSNEAEVTFNAPGIAAFKALMGINNIPIHLGGLVAHAATGSEITSCRNTGAVSYELTAVETNKVSCGTNRPRVGGLVGMAFCNISNSTNSGAVVAHAQTSDKTIYKANNYPLNVGGISGGSDSSAAGASGANITECVNEGAIDYITYCDGAIPTCGGIVGYPGYENASQTNLITKCTNRGDITCFAQDEARVGGINGGIGNITYCKNYGKITGTMPYGDACIGGISAFHSQKLKFEYNESYGDLSNLNGSTEVVEIGGLIGQHGNVVSYEGEGRGCIVNCNITYDWGNHKWYGLTIGWKYGDKEVTLGTASEPIKILGGSMSNDGGKTVVKITADNYETYLKGPGSKDYSVFAKFGE